MGTMNSEQVIEENIEPDVQAIMRLLDSLQSTNYMYYGDAGSDSEADSDSDSEDGDINQAHETHVPPAVLITEFKKIDKVPPELHMAILRKLESLPSTAAVSLDIMSDLYEIQEYLTDGEYKFFVSGLGRPIEESCDTNASEVVEVPPFRAPPPRDPLARSAALRVLRSPIRANRGVHLPLPPYGSHQRTGRDI